MQQILSLLPARRGGGDRRRFLGAGGSPDTGHHSPRCPREAGGGLGTGWVVALCPFLLGQGAAGDIPAGGTLVASPVCFWSCFVPPYFTVLRISRGGRLMNNMMGGDRNSPRALRVSFCGVPGPHVPPMGTERRPEPLQQLAGCAPVPGLSILRRK